MWYVRLWNISLHLTGFVMRDVDKIMYHCKRPSESLVNQNDVVDNQNARGQIGRVEKAMVASNATLSEKTYSVPLLSHSQRSRQWREKRRHDPLFFHSFRLGSWILIDLRFGSGVMDEVVATMVSWNKVSPVSPYLNDVQSGIDEEPMRVWPVRSNR